MVGRAGTLALLVALGAWACRRGAEPMASTAPRPSVLLVTLDTTRADAMGPEASGSAARG